MVVLPAQLALMRGAEGQLGVLQKADTNNPELVVDTVEVNCNRQVNPLWNKKSNN
jgi:hypothetical protein